MLTGMRDLRVVRVADSTFGRSSRLTDPYLRPWRRAATGAATTCNKRQQEAKALPLATQDQQ